MCIRDRRKLVPKINKNYTIYPVDALREFYNRIKKFCVGVSFQEREKSFENFLLLASVAQRHKVRPQLLLLLSNFTERFGLTNFSSIENSIEKLKNYCINKFTTLESIWENVKSKKGGRK